MLYYFLDDNATQPTSVPTSANELHALITADNWPQTAESDDELMGSTTDSFQVPFCTSTTGTCGGSGAAGGTASAESGGRTST